MSLARLFRKARKEKWAIGQFNFCTWEQLKGIALAAEKLSAPVILGTSQGEIGFLGLEETVSVARVLKKKGLRLFLHLDHGRDWKIIKRAIDSGYDSVQFDGSLLSFAENLKLTKKVVKYAHRKGVFVEGELGRLRGESELFSERKPVIRKEELAKAEEVEKFTEQTKIDSLAIAIGSIHGVFFKESKPDFEKLNFDRLREIRRITDVFLVLHGGSGIPKVELKEAIEYGMQKININTDIRVIWKKELKEALRKTKGVKPYQILPLVINKIKTRVEAYIRLFGGDNKI